MQRVQMRGGIQYKIHLLCDLSKWCPACANKGWNRVQIIICYTAGADEEWNTVQYLFIMQLVQLTSNLCRCGVEHSTIFIILLCSLCKWGVEHSIIGQMTQTYANEGWNTVQYCVTCANEEWNTVQYSFVMQLVQMRLIHAMELRVQCQITMVTKLFRPITDHGMHWWKWYSP